MNTTFDWFGLLRLVLLWIVVVFLALRALDLLFPRLRRDDADTPTLPPPSGQPAPRLGTTSRSLTVLATRRPAGRLAATLAPRAGQAYWQTNVRMIVVLLLIWAGSWLIPAALAPWLNQFHILTGFPLGYYMGSQGSLIVFLGLITAYAWRAARLDARFRAAPWLPGSVREGRAATRRIGVIYILFTAGFVLFALLMGGLEQQVGLPATTIGWALLIVTIGLYAVIGITNRTRSLDDYFVAGRRIPAFFNGMAIGADWMSAAPAYSGLFQRHGDRRRLDERGIVHLHGRHTLAARL